MTPQDKQPLLKSDFANDPEIRDLVEQFVRGLPGRVEDLQVAFRDGNALRVRTLAHQITGSAGGYGFPAIGMAAQKVDECLRAAGTSASILEKIRVDVDELVDLCRRATVPAE